MKQGGDIATKPSGIGTKGSLNDSELDVEKPAMNWSWVTGIIIVLLISGIIIREILRKAKEDVR